jgi:hypothetical protein
MVALGFFITAERKNVHQSYEFAGNHYSNRDRHFQLQKVGSAVAASGYIFYTNNIKQTKKQYPLKRILFEKLIEAVSL